MDSVRDDGPDPRRSVPDPRPGRIRHVFAALAVLALLAGIGNVIRGQWTFVQDYGPFDFSVNWVAAQRLLDDEPLYDRAASRKEAIERVGPSMSESNRDPYTSYIGMPVTALTYVPFTAFDHDEGADLYRATLLIGMVAAIVITGLTLPASARLTGISIGIGALLCSFSAAKSLALGNVDHWVMLGLAVGIWGTTRQRWGVAGVGLGVATALKFTPGLLVVYLMLQRKWRAVAFAASTGVALQVAAVLVGRPHDLWVWFSRVAGSAGGGDINVDNQAIAAWIGRLLSSRNDFVHHHPLGAWRFIGYALLIGGVVAYWWFRRERGVQPLDFAVLIALILAAGPLTWDHYAVWLTIPLVLIVHPDNWARRRVLEQVVLLGALAVATVLLRVMTSYPDPADVAVHWYLRFLSGPKLGAAVLYLAVGLWLVLRGAPAHVTVASRPVREVGVVGAS